MAKGNYAKRMAKGNYERYLDSDYRTLSDVYAKCSYAKEAAMEHCRKLCAYYNGHELKIISYNTYNFTAGFMFEEDGKNMFMYITSGYRQAVEV